MVFAIWPVVRVLHFLRLRVTSLSRTRSLSVARWSSAAFASISPRRFFGRRARVVDRPRRRTEERDDELSRSAVARRTPRSVVTGFRRRALAASSAATKVRTDDARGRLFGQTERLARREDGSAHSVRRARRGR